ncbi:hypothetical protein Taro_046970, partial [Colocasia esculenta]|nr:hypothetical protein [Colocasia esculenta]
MSWYILSSSWLVLQHSEVRNTMVMTPIFQARPEVLLAFFNLVPWFITEFALFSQLPTLHFDSLVSSNISSDIRPLIVVVKVVVVVTKSRSNIRCSLLDEDRLGVVLAPHAHHFDHEAAGTRVAWLAGGEAAWGVASAHGRASPVQVFG